MRISYKLLSCVMLKPGDESWYVLCYVQGERARTVSDCATFLQGRFERRVGESKDLSLMARKGKSRRSRKDWLSECRVKMPSERDGDGSTDESDVCNLLLIIS